MKVSIEVSGITATIECEEYVGLDELLNLVDQAIKGVGFFPKGQLGYEEEC